MTTLFDAIYKTAECLKGLRHSNSTDAGSATTLVDANLTEPDDFFKGGTIWFVSGALAGKTAIISGYDSSTHTFTFATQVSAPGTGIAYAALDQNYSREALVAAINAALSALGPYPAIYEDASFLTVANQEEYTLPAGVYDVRKVFIATNAQAPFNYQLNVGWFENNGKLIFDMETPTSTDMRIRLYYEHQHAAVSLDADLILDMIFPDLLAWTAASRAVITRMGVAENSEPHTKEMQPFSQQMANAQRGHTIKHFQKSIRPSGW